MINDHTGQTAACYRKRLPLTNYDVQDEDYEKALSSPKAQQTSIGSTTLLNDFLSVTEPNPQNIAGAKTKMFLKSHQNVLNWKEKDESQSDRVKEICNEQFKEQRILFTSTRVLSKNRTTQSEIKHRVQVLKI